VRVDFGDDSVRTFDVAHVDLYFFYDIDIVVLVVELAAARDRQFTRRRLETQGLTAGE
jgi:hypothetical protein